MSEPLGVYLDVAARSLVNLRASRPDDQPLVVVIGAESPTFSLSRGDLFADSDSFLLAIADLSAQITIANIRDSFREATP